MITHITKKEIWEKIKQNEVYEPESLKSDGFIHCSKINQVVKVANYLFSEEKNLVLLCIDEEKVNSRIVFEDLYQAGEKYPHIYGPMEVEAVTAVYDFNPDEKGSFTLPEELSE